MPATTTAQAVLDRAARAVIDADDGAGPPVAVLVGRDGAGERSSAVSVPRCGWVVLRLASASPGLNPWSDHGDDWWRWLVVPRLPPVPAGEEGADGVTGYAPPPAGWRPATTTGGEGDDASSSLLFARALRHAANGPFHVLLGSVPLDDNDTRVGVALAVAGGRVLRLSTTLPFVPSRQRAVFVTTAATVGPHSHASRPGGPHGRLGAAVRALCGRLLSPFTGAVAGTGLAICIAPRSFRPALVRARPDGSFRLARSVTEALVRAGEPFAWLLPNTGACMGGFVWPVVVDDA